MRMIPDRWRRRWRASRPLVLATAVALVAATAVLGAAGVGPAAALLYGQDQAQAGAAYPAAVLATPGLQDYYRLDEAAGPTVHDQVGHRDGTATGGVRLGAPGAIVGTAAAFDGASGAISVAGGNAAVTGSRLSLEGWVRPSGPRSGDQQYFGWRNYVSSDFYVEQLPGGNRLEARLRVAGGAAFTINTVTIQPGVWHHLALTYNGATLTLYLDGAARASVTAHGSITDGQQTLRIGGFDNHWLAGSVDEVALYRGALSSAQVAAHNTAGRAAGTTSTSTSTSAPTTTTGTATTASTTTGAPTTTAATGPGPVAAGNVTIDFTRTVQTLDPNAIGLDESAYGGDHVLTSDAVQQQRLRTLRIGYARIALGYATPGDPASAIICTAAGCDHQISGDAAALVRHFNKDTANSIHTWVVGNEPDLNGVDAATYSARFNAIVDAMKAVDPTIKVGGGTTAWFDDTFLKAFLAASGSRLEFVDFHVYPEGGSKVLSNDQLLAEAVGLETHLRQLRGFIQAAQPQRAAQIGINVGEWNLSWSAFPIETTNFNTVWSASMLGHILATGRRSLVYADKGGLGGALYDNAATAAQYGQQLDDPMPIYHGLGMFTGEGLFPHFGTSLAAATTTLPGVEVYTSSDPDEIVVINTSASSASAAFALTGVPSGSAHLWRKDPSVRGAAAPADAGTVAVSGGNFQATLPPSSVTTVVITAG